jgi:hypothetical protein
MLPIKNYVQNADSDDDDRYDPEPHPSWRRGGIITTMPTIQAASEG